MRLDTAIAPAEQSRLKPGERDSFLSFVALLFAVAVVVFLIACFNVATLTVSRAAAREHEVAIRSALDAGRRRIVQQTLVENLVRSGLAIVTALPAAAWMSHVLTGFGPSSPLSAAVGADIDARVIAFGAGLALVTGVYRSARIDPGPNPPSTFRSSSDTHS